MNQRKIALIGGSLALLFATAWILGRAPAPTAPGPLDATPGDRSTLTNMKWLPASMTACARDSDCVLVVRTSCCDTEAGAINSAKRDAYDQLVAQKPRWTDCPAIVCPKIDKPVLRPRCLSGGCWLTQADLPGAR